MEGPWSTLGAKSGAKSDRCTAAHRAPPLSEGCGRVLHATGRKGCKGPAQMPCRAVTCAPPTPAIATCAPARVLPRPMHVPLRGSAATAAWLAATSSTLSWLARTRGLEENILASKLTSCVTPARPSPCKSKNRSAAPWRTVSVWRGVPRLDAQRSPQPAAADFCPALGGRTMATDEHPLYGDCVRDCPTPMKP